MLCVHKAVWEGCSLRLHCIICCAFGWKFFLWSSFTENLYYAKFRPPAPKFVSLSVRSWMQIAVLSAELLQSLFHFNKCWLSQETGRQWKLYSTCQTCCCAFFEIPQNGGKEVKVFYLPCLLFLLLQLLCESHSVKNILKGKVDY